MLDLTRIAYLAIVGVLALTVVAVCSVVSGTGGGDDGELPEITAKQIVDYARFGMVEEVNVDDRNVTVTFVDTLDTEEAFGEASRRFRATLAEGETMTQLILDAGLTVGAGGVEVNGEQTNQQPDVPPELEPDAQPDGPPGLQPDGQP